MFREYFAFLVLGLVDAQTGTIPIDILVHTDCDAAAAGDPAGTPCCDQIFADVLNTGWLDATCACTDANADLTSPVTDPTATEFKCLCKTTHPFGGGQGTSAATDVCKSCTEFSLASTFNVIDGCDSAGNSAVSCTSDTNVAIPDTTFDSTVDPSCTCGNIAANNYDATGVLEAYKCKCDTGTIASDSAPYCKLCTDFPSTATTQYQVAADGTTGCGCFTTADVNVAIADATFDTISQTCACDAAANPQYSGAVSNSLCECATGAIILAANPFCKLCSDITVTGYSIIANAAVNNDCKCYISDGSAEIAAATFSSATEACTCASCTQCEGSIENDKCKCTDTYFIGTSFISSQDTTKHQ